MTRRKQFIQLRALKKYVKFLIDALGVREKE
jgi:hypothetical protein